MRLLTYRHIGENEEQRLRERPFALERLIFFSDAVFAIAITLLALDLRITHTLPVEFDNVSLWRELVEQAPHFLSFIVSFYVIGSFWCVHHRYFRWIARYDDQLIARNLLTLFFVSLLPFTSALVGEHEQTQLATVLYAVNIAAVSLSGLFMWRYATRNCRLTQEGFDPTLIRYIQMRALTKPTTAIFVIAASFAIGSWANAAWILVPLTIAILDHRFLSDPAQTSLPQAAPAQTAPAQTAATQAAPTTAASTKAQH